MKLKKLESRNLMPFFHIYVLKSRKYNPAKYYVLKIAKLSTNKVRASYLDGCLFDWDVAFWATMWT